MGGFAKVAIVAEHYGQKIVNTFSYRGIGWVPGYSGNVYDEVQKLISDFWTNIQTEWLGCHNGNYRVLQVSGVGLNDAYHIVTPAPCFQTINVAGSLNTSAWLETTGSSVCANLSWALGEQVQINGVGHSLRNRGYISIGPIPEIGADSYGHIAQPMIDAIEDVAKKLDDTLIDIPNATSFVPVRIHEKWVYNVWPLPNVLILRTYSDILGYRLPRVASWRKSRQPEA